MCFAYTLAIDCYPLDFKTVFTLFLFCFIKKLIRQRKNLYTKRKFDLREEGKTSFLKNPSSFRAVEIFTASNQGIFVLNPWVSRKIWQSNRKIVLAKSQPFHIWLPPKKGKKVKPILLRFRKTNNQQNRLLLYFGEFSAREILGCGLTERTI